MIAAKKKVFPGSWGGKREGAGRPKSETARESRHIKFSDEEWDMIKQKAARRGLSLREYIHLLAESDNPR